MMRSFVESKTESHLLKEDFGMTTAPTSSIMRRAKREWQPSVSTDDNATSLMSLHIENPEYQPHLNLNECVDGDSRKMRGWQESAFKSLKDSRNCIIQAYCGSGKSLLQVWLSIYDILSSGYTRKQIIAVPQSHIHQSFSGDGSKQYITLEYDGKDYDWWIDNNFCSDDSNDNVKGLKAFTKTRV